MMDLKSKIVFGSFAIGTAIFFLSMMKNTEDQNFSGINASRIPKISLGAGVKIAGDWPKPIFNFVENPLKSDWVALGRKLFFETGISRDGKVSCGSCHSPSTAFAHVDHKLSHGVYDREGRRNAPALINLAWNKYFMWDASIHNIELQSLSPITQHTEMDLPLDSLLFQLRALGYDKAFRQLKKVNRVAANENALNIPNVLKAFAQFQLSLISQDSRYDSVMRKLTNFNAQQLNGYRLFQIHCNACHKEPLFTTGELANNGLPGWKNRNGIRIDKGFADLSGNVRDEGKFKIPTLRNVEYTFPYMHDGRFQTLGEVIKKYNTLTTSVLDDDLHRDVRLLKPLGMSDNDRVDLLSFLLTLTDPKFIHNPDYIDPSSSKR